MVEQAITSLNIEGWLLKTDHPITQGLPACAKFPSAGNAALTGAGQAHKEHMPPTH